MLDQEYRYDRPWYCSPGAAKVLNLLTMYCIIPNRANDFISDWLNLQFVLKKWDAIDVAHEKNSFVAFGPVMVGVVDIHCNPGQQ